MVLLKAPMKCKYLLSGKYCICGYCKCVDALEFHHENPNGKDFKLISGNTMS